MGVDATIYAKNAKRKCYFDRISNIEAVWDLPEVESTEGADLCERVKRGNMFFKGGLTKAEVLRLCELNRIAWETREESQKYHIAWVEKIRRFVEGVGEDTYFVVSDQDSDWFLYDENGDKAYAEFEKEEVTVQTTIEHNGITIDLTMSEPPTEMKDRGWIHQARVIGKATRDDLSKLRGLTLWGDAVLGVESRAIENQTDAPIGLLLKSKKW